MTVKAKFEKGKLIPKETIALQEGEVYEIEIRKPVLHSFRFSELKEMIGVLSLGGDAVEDAEMCFEA